jgi:hypothetical protein
MTDIDAAVLAQLMRQIAHFSDAAVRLGDLSSVASPTGWQSLERQLGAAIRAVLEQGIARLARRANALRAQALAAENASELRAVRTTLLAFRRDYLAFEAVVEFFGDAINTRTSADIGAQLRALDFIAQRSIQEVLTPLGRRAPPVLTYLRKGIGASILSEGLKLWDNRSRSPVAAIKVVRHNLVRPTSILHEAGHQISHLLGFVPELAAAFSARAPGGDRELGALWSGWASEVAGDAFAFAHAGFGAVAALHDVVAGEPERVTDIQAMDPHPASWVRVLLGVAMCRRFFGAGPWDQMSLAWRALYPLSGAEPREIELLRGSDAALSQIVETIFELPYRAFRGQSLKQLLDPERVRPDVLLGLEGQAGAALYSSSVWVKRECLRLLALSGYRLATETDKSAELLNIQQGWMRRLGEVALAA